MVYLEALDDVVLVERVRAGDHEAFGVLFDRYAQTVYGYAVRRLVGAADRLTAAEDVLSMVFLQVWSGRARIVVVEGSARAWLLGVAGNVMRNEARSRRRHQAALARCSATVSTSTEDPATEVCGRLDRESGAAQAVLAIGRLGARERAVADLVLVEGLPIATVALVLGLPEGTVRSRLDRARRHLRVMLRTSDLDDTETGTGHQRVGRAPYVPVEGSSPA